MVRYCGMICFALTCLYARSTTSPLPTSRPVHRAESFVPGTASSGRAAQWRRDPDSLWGALFLRGGGQEDDEGRRGLGQAGVHGIDDETQRLWEACRLLNAAKAQRAINAGASVDAAHAKSLWSALHHIDAGSESSGEADGNGERGGDDGKPWKNPEADADGNREAAEAEAKKAERAWAIVSMLKDCGADLNKRAKVGATPLHLAAARGSFPAVSALLRLGAEPEIPDNFQRRPLHYAAASGDEACTFILLNVTTDIDAVDQVGGTPLMAAARMGRSSVVALLLSFGADPKLEDKARVTARGQAIKKKHFKAANILQAPHLFAQSRGDHEDVVDDDDDDEKEGKAGGGKEGSETGRREQEGDEKLVLGGGVDDVCEVSEGMGSFWGELVN